MQWKWKSCQLCNPMDLEFPMVHGILQARILEWVAFPFSRGSSQSRDQTQVSRVAGRFFTSWATREAQEYWSGSHLFSSRSSWPRNWTGVSRIAGGFFTSWAMREAHKCTKEFLKIVHIKKKKKKYCKEHNSISNLPQDPEWIIELTLWASVSSSVNWGCWLSSRILQT